MKTIGKVFPAEKPVQPPKEEVVQEDKQKAEKPKAKK